MSELAHIKEGRNNHNQYKPNTKIFKVWLFDTAVRCGWMKSEENSRAVKDIKNQIDLVSKTRVQQNYIPEHVHTALVSAINGRKAFLEEFRSTRLTNKGLEDSHGYFLRVLNHALVSLPRMKPATERENAMAANSSPMPSSDNDSKEPSSDDDSKDGWTLVKSRKTKAKR